MEFLSIPACISVQLMYSVVMEQNKHLHKWSPTFGRGVEIGSVPFDHGTGEYTLAAAKRAAQDHHNTTQAHV